MNDQKELFLNVERSLSGKIWIKPDDKVRRLATSLQQVSSIPYPLAILLAQRQITADKIETFLDPKVARGQKQKWYPWPYTEGITIEEASNVLTFMASGIYGKELPKQNGAPLRLVLPWKYGFKSIKSIKKITFTDKIPLSFWESLQPTEYGFWANVNPNIPHARWSQETEKLIGDEIKVVPTQLFNGYQDYVEHLYTKDQKYYF